MKGEYILMAIAAAAVLAALYILGESRQDQAKGVVNIVKPFNVSV